MSRSNPGSGSRRRKPAGSRTMNRLLRRDAGKPCVSKIARRESKAYPEDDMGEMMDSFGDIDAILERRASSNTQDAAIRRRIEMLRDERRLQQELSDIYDA